MNRIRLVLLLHNHQPVGNFDHIFQQAYEDSYRPFLEVFSRYDNLKIALHTSGPLMEWLDRHHPGYLDQLRELVRAGRVEIVGGPFFEPILAMIPSADRIGQIRRYREWLENRLDARVRGMWMPERVWEQSYVRDLVEAGIEYTLLDDYHFKAAGLDDAQLTRHFTTEDDGRVMAVFPGSERLRYTIPFADPQATIDYLRETAQRDPQAVVVFGDDGEKFGTWPDTKKHVYEDRWLERFFDVLDANRDWLSTTTLAEAYDNVEPAGKIYLPDCSYREMTEWALPVEKQQRREALARGMEHDPRWGEIREALRGGFWRNFRAKYSEADEMYTRMMGVSRRLRELAAHRSDEAIASIRDDLYRGQCNCPYWHGAFGGIYLPHLRNAIYRHLIRADNALERLERGETPWIDAVAGDFNFDGRQEVCLANDRLAAWIDPRFGGRMYELDLRQFEHNLLATMTRRPEAYHAKVLAGAHQQHDGCASIHDRVVFKQEGLDRRICYDRYQRKSLIDLFYSLETSLDAVAAGEATIHGDFVDQPYDAKIQRNPDRIRVLLSREGRVDGRPVRVIKAVTLEAGKSLLEIAYRLENVPQDFPLHFAVEFNFAGMPAGADDRYFFDGYGQSLGDLGTRLDLHDSTELGLVDRWQGFGVRLRMSQPGGFWTFPVESVSQSEGGFELVHQSVVVQPHWLVQADASGTWTVCMHLHIDRAEALLQSPAEYREPAMTC
ncbi:MAG: DUF1926 domain-containing protein [Planctomycetota bacterium]|nr:MAG: DUF1926 domain-containing protein [Planctomycetota bacterium]